MNVDVLYTNFFLGAESNCREKEVPKANRKEIETTKKMGREEANENDNATVKKWKDEFDLASAHYLDDSGHQSIHDSDYMTAKKNFYERTTSYSKINFNDRNPLYNIYDEDVYKYLMWRELTGYGRPRPNYMVKQNDVNIEMRAILIDWFVDVCLDYDLSPFTFFMTVSIVDRALSAVDCPREKFQLLGAAALVIAT